MTDPDLVQALKDFTEAPRIPNLGELSSAVKEMLELTEQVATMENELNVVKAKLQAVRVGRVPGLMAELGLSEVKTDLGHKITIDTVVTCKFMPEHKEAALQWLEANNYGGLIKSDVSVQFGKDSEREVQSAVAALRAVGLEPKVDKGVHAMTLKAWATRQVEGGAPIPSNLFDFNTFSIAKVK